MPWILSRRKFGVPSHNVGRTADAFSSYLTRPSAARLTRLPDLFCLRDVSTFQRFTILAYRAAVIIPTAKRRKKKKPRDRRAMQGSYTQVKHKCDCCPSVIALGMCKLNNDQAILKIVFRCC
jgi:hypothetical protein